MISRLLADAVLAAPAAVVYVAMLVDGRRQRRAIAEEWERIEAKVRELDEV